MSDAIEHLFGSAARVKILRLFLFNPHDGFSARQIADRTGLQARTARSNAKKLHSIEFLHVEEVRPRSKHASKTKVSAWRLNHTFPFRDALHSLLIRSEVFDTEQLADGIKQTGDIQLLLLSGVFIHNPNTRVDICVVGDDLDRDKLEQMIHDFEQGVGTELRYAILETGEFEYRRSMYDRLVRDIIESQHEPLIDKLGIAVTSE